jgi:hypothetical protein
MGNATLTRTPFRTSRLLDFLSEKELTAQIGHAKAAWPLVAVKELLDNALDACEEAGTPPEIELVVDQDSIVVADNGPGIPETTVRDVLDFSSRVSSREAYVAPDRGAQGNALKSRIAMPFVLNGEEGRVELISCGIRHDIRICADRIRQEPVIVHDPQPAEGRFVRNGTSVKLHWPNSPRSEADDNSFADDDDAGDLEDSGIVDRNSPSSILVRAKSRFLQIADDFTFLNPHLTLSVNWHGERIIVQATDPAHPKWVPSQPTCAHWYKPEHLERLVAAYIAHDRDSVSAHVAHVCAGRVSLASRENEAKAPSAPTWARRANGFLPAPLSATFCGYSGHNRVQLSRSDPSCWAQSQPEPGSFPALIRR